MHPSAGYLTSAGRIAIKIFEMDPVLDLVLKYTAPILLMQQLYFGSFKCFVVCIC